MNTERALRDALLDALEAPGQITKSRIRSILINNPASDPAGYVIADKKTGAIDWDGEVHPTVEAAIESMCGPFQSFSREKDDPDKDYWGDVYDILACASGGAE
ncbi:hypothetical protein [Arthrobacter sp. FW306-06-A]|uniref:hypothetical protein n=1 Tax=Arthrobacter sp. FW306-06-A TaxID=2879621 RepID=UPI001F34B5BB|nr:hypothetical protein [Arthrobacter sp. FW306-06-A]UKA69563.1 hypothetical protein LFT49_12345 [Arthrobacter sp. FW306-06-A]